MAVATKGDETLSPDSVGDMLEELLEAQNQSYVLGLKLKLPLHIVDAIHSTYLQPGDRLLRVLIEFTKQIDPRPTWRVIIDALRTRVVNLPHLAKKVEAAHLPDPTAACDVVSETAPTATQNETVTDISHDVNTSGQTGVTPSTALDQTTSNSLLPQLTPTTGDYLPTNDRAPSPDHRPVSSQDVRTKIRELEKRFNDLKKVTRECLEKHGVTVKRVADALMSLPADDVIEHKQFLESHVRAFYQAIDHSELFGTLSTNWNYLSYQLLDHLITEFDLNEVKCKMEAFKEDLRQFREKTPLTLFCQTQKRRRLRLEPAFREMVAEFNWPDDVTLEVVEQFRQEYAYHYSLRECAMMLALIHPGSFIITWCIPESIVEKLRANMPKEILKKYSVTELTIAGRCVYRLHQHKIPTKTLSSSYGPFDTGATTASVGAATPHDGSTSVGGSMSQITPSSEHEYSFVEEPSEDFFCPVTYGLLLHPHLTECCGNHLSQEAATKIQREGGACPMCTTTGFNTVLDKHFLRQVNALRVFCRHEDRGCDWQGELSDLERHVQSCPRTITQSMTGLQNLPWYHDRETICEDIAGYQPLKFRLDGVALSTNRLGNGAYAEVREASVPCAAKILHSVLVDPKHPRNQECFEQECSILGECFHPNIVRFFGVSVNPTTGQTALLMELMSETLTHFLEVTYKDRKLPYCHQLHISHDIANGVKYLHSKRIIHRDLSSNNVLLKGSTITAKISDFGMSMLQDEKHTRLTQCPGTAVYMPPEAFGTTTTTCYEKIDSFQMGVLMLQIATQKFPAPSDRFEKRPNPQSPTGYSLDPISEKVRRDNHLQLLREPRVMGEREDRLKELEDHPMLDHLILDCLEDKEEKRPTAKFVYDHLSRLMMDERYKRDCRKHRVPPRISGEGLVENGVERNSRTESRESELEARIQALSRENEQLTEQLQRDGRESREHLQAVEYQLRQQLEQRVSTSGAQVQALERDNHTLQGQLEEMQRRMQAQINNLEGERRQLRHHNGQLVQQMEGYRHQQNASVSQQVVALQNQLATQALEHQAQIDGLVRQYQQATQEATRSQASLREELKVKETELERLVARHTCRIIGPPLQSITANSRGCIEAELCDSDGKPRNVGDNTPLSAVLSPVTNSADPPIVCEIKPLEKRFEVSYELSDPGKYQLSIRFQNKQILGGITLSVYPDPRPPTVLVPRRFIMGLKKPYGIAVNKHREVLVSELYGNKVSVYDIDKPGKVKCCIGETVPMMRPRGVATDETDNVYVTSDHRLQKFRSETYELLNSVGADDEGDQDHEFHSPSGLTVFGNEVYVCDQQNHRIQVFDLDLNFFRTIASNRKGQYQFNLPGDVAFDREGRMYVAEHGRERVQVLTADGKHLQMIGERERMKPESVHVVNDYLYVSDFSREHRVAVFQTSGKYVASLGSEGDGEGQWLDPRGIASCEGRIYVCGSEDGHVHVLRFSVK